MMDTIDEYHVSDDERLSKELNDVFAKLNSMSESEKVLYLRNRQADTSDKRKRGYKYYYVELLDDSKRNVYNNFALLIRTNNLYVQYWTEIMII